MNRAAVLAFLELFFAGLKSKAQKPEYLKPFLDLILALKKNSGLSIPLLKELAALETGADWAADNPALLHRRLNRRYLRLCRVQYELGRLDFKKANADIPGVSLEDFVFSKIDFSRYREINKDEFYGFFLEGLSDFDGGFLKKNFGLPAPEIKSTLETAYEKNEKFYRLKKESPLVLSIMRTLETSLEALPLFRPDEIAEEAKNIFCFLAEESGRREPENFSGAEKLYRLLVSGLDKITIRHSGEVTTKLFINPRGDLAGTFMPQGKPWTFVLIRA